MAKTAYQSCMKRELKGERHRSRAGQERAFAAAARRCARGRRHR